MNQPTLFDMTTAKVKRTRVGRRKTEHRNAFRLFLLGWRMEIEKEHPRSIRQVQSEYHVSHFPMRLMPKDFKLRSIDGITQRYSDKIYRLVSNYNKNADRVRNDRDNEKLSQMQEQLKEFKRSVEMLLDQINTIILEH